MADDEQDEDIKLAIALSLQSSRNPEPSKTNEDEDLERAIQLSLQETHWDSQTDTVLENISKLPEILQPSKKDPSNSAVQGTTSTSTPQHHGMGMLGIDRKKMEEERLARVAHRQKRQFSESTSTTADYLAAKRQRMEPDKEKATLPAAVRSSHPTLQYPKGIVKQTWARGFPRENDITIDEVLLRNHLKTAVLSSFQWDADWLSTKINTADSKMILIIAAKTEQEKQAWLADEEAVGRRKLRICFPPLDGARIIHSKLMLLSYPDSLRIVIPTANLVPYDWGESGVMENTVFLIDLPLASGGTTSEENLTPFGKELLYFLRKSKVPQFAADGILKFDFSATSKMAFVHSIGGANFGSDLERTGFNSLSRAVCQLGLKTEEPLDIEYATASLGSLKESYLDTIKLAASGERSLIRTVEGSRAGQSTRTGQLRVYFPTLETIKASIGGTDSAGTICFNRSSYNSSTFPRQILRKHESKRSRLLSHSKIILAHTPSQKTAWAYIGSANLSESAWGKIVLDKATKKNKLVCSNWECGVLISLSPEEPPSISSFGNGEEHQGKIEKSADSEPKSLEDLFTPILHLPFKTPGALYGEAEPWFYTMEPFQRS